MIELSKEVNKMNAVFPLTLWIINSIFFYLAFIIWPNGLVLGNNIRSPIVALMLSAFLLMLIVVFATSIMKFTGIKLRKNRLFLFNLFVNVAGIWMIARMATFTGFGIVSFWVALILGAILNFLQWFLWKTIVKKT